VHSVTVTAGATLARSVHPIAVTVTVTLRAMTHSMIAVTVAHVVFALAWSVLAVTRLLSCGEVATAGSVETVSGCGSGRKGRTEREDAASNQSRRPYSLSIRRDGRLDRISMCVLCHLCDVLSVVCVSLDTHSRPSLDVSCEKPLWLP
jgi:hypothetical protein